MILSVAAVPDIACNLAAVPDIACTLAAVPDIFCTLAAVPDIAVPVVDGTGRTCRLQTIPGGV